jgi:uncharacterized membrane protein
MALRGKDVSDRNVQTIVEMERITEEQRSFGERVADRFVKVVGCWTFIIVQSVLLLIWLALNVSAWVYHWDPYPFILLNLALSFQAAYATPIIMMSQNRQDKMATRRNHLDLQINLLAEQESTETLRLLRKLCEHAGISMDSSSKALEDATRPEELAQQIDKVRDPET